MMPGGQSEHGAGIESAAQVATDRHVRAQSQTDCLLERVTKLCDVLMHQGAERHPLPRG